MSNLPYCRQCNRQMNPGETYLNVLGGTYHNNCFNCRKCNTYIGTNQFYNINNEPYCANCHKHHEVPNCATCSQPLTRGSDFLKYEGLSYHSNCFQCTSCRTPLGDSDFFKSANGRLCGNCNDRVSGGNSGGGGNYSSGGNSGGGNYSSGGNSGGGNYSSGGNSGGGDYNDSGNKSGGYDDFDQNAEVADVGGFQAQPFGDDDDDDLGDLGDFGGFEATIDEPEFNDDFGETAEVAEVEDLGDEFDLGGDEFDDMLNNLEDSANDVQSTYLDGDDDINLQSALSALDDVNINSFDSSSD